MKLIIAEKPMLARAVADAIDGSAVQKNGYTEKGDYVITSAFGHLLTLKDPEDYDPRYAKWTLRDLPIYFDNWEKKPGEGKKERLDQIGELLKDADCVIHAGDPDDEGQYLIDEILGWFSYKGPVYRLATGDTTRAALKKALANMKDNKEFENSGWSSHARSVADMMVGYNFSRYFTLLNPQVKMLTVGRVQTPALGLVVARDMAIENHVKSAYFTVKVDLLIDGKTITAVYELPKDDPRLSGGRITDENYVNDAVKALNGKVLDNIDISKKSLTEQPPLPFNLVKLQTYCSAKFGYDPSKTLEITQSLRDRHNAITYNRSDCQYLSEEQYKEAPGTVRQVMKNLRSDPAAAVFSRLPIDTALHSKAFDDKNITAHTAIIPQNRDIDLSNLTEEERNVYLAVVKYYMAQFLPPAEKERTSLEAAALDGVIKANSTKVLSPGFMQLIRPEKDKEEGEDEEESESELSSIAPGRYKRTCEKAYSEAKETKAPPRYTKASLNEDMTRIAKYVTDPRAKELLLSKDKDKKGENGSIGTSATRSGIIDTLEERGYIESKGKTIRSTQLGRELLRILPDELKKPDMTGYWWAVQEEIKDGQVPWTDLTDSVLEMIKKVVHTDYPKVDSFLIPESMRRGRANFGNCPRCGEPVIEGERGFGCSGYKKGCSFVIWKDIKSGMMSKTKITGDMVHEWLSGEWTDETRTNSDGSEYSTGKKRSKNTVALKKLYSEKSGNTYGGLVYLTDDGKTRSAGFGLQELVREEPKSLGKCPRCGKDVFETKNGYGCSGFKDGCKFIIWEKQKQKMLANVSFTKTDAKKFLAGKTVSKKKLLDKKGQEFSAELLMIEEPGNPYGPVFRAVEGTIEVKDGDPAGIRTETVPAPENKDKKN
ncbi:MAG: DNA topoisomerase III [Firmicutes bacterium]|nr:DNA topoisomerase III [Bacillota bacterium]